MENELVSYKQAKALKELGFNETCFSYYKNDKLTQLFKLINNSEINNYSNDVNNYITAPLKQQAFRWFREHCKDVFYIKMSSSHTYYINLNQKLIGEFETYEEAETFLIDQLINNGQSNT
jgi:hypothetical protein